MGLGVRLVGGTENPVCVHDADGGGQSGQSGGDHENGVYGGEDAFDHRKLG